MEDSQGDRTGTVLSQVSWATLSQWGTVNGFRDIVHQIGHPSELTQQEMKQSAGGCKEMEWGKKFCLSKENWSPCNTLLLLLNSTAASCPAVISSGLVHRVFKIEMDSIARLLPLMGVNPALWEVRKG